MSNRKKYFFVFCFIILDMFLLIGFLIIRDATSLNVLRKEVNELSKLDITRDRYNRDIKSNGNYAIVESAIKEYLDNYAVSLQNVLAVMNDTQLISILSYENYVADGPEFKNSIGYLNASKIKFNKEMDLLLEELEENNIKGYIYEKIDDPYYVSLYQELMMTSDMKNDFNQNRNLLENIQIKVNNLFDTSLEVLNFLNLYKDSWKVEDGEIKFATVDLYNYYNTLISKVKEN